MEMNKPKLMYFVKNSGEFFLGLNKNNKEIIVSTDVQVLKDMGFNQVSIPNNQILEVGQDCSYTLTALEKQIQI
jgi:hypothetical protein